jgi:hypothetical protein
MNSITQLLFPVTGAKRKHILCRAFLLYLTVPARSLLRATNSRAKRVRPARRDAHLAPHPPNPASVSAASTAAPNVIIWFLVPEVTRSQNANVRRVRLVAVFTTLLLATSAPQTPTVRSDPSSRFMSKIAFGPSSGQTLVP